MALALHWHARFVPQRRSPVGRPGKGNLDPGKVLFKRWFEIFPTSCASPQKTPIAKPESILLTHPQSVYHGNVWKAHCSLRCVCSNLNLWKKSYMSVMMFWNVQENKLGSDPSMLSGFTGNCSRFASPLSTVLNLIQCLTASLHWSDTKSFH